MGMHDGTETAVPCAAPAARELATLNEELRNAIDEAHAAKADIANLMESSDIAVVFVNRELHIRQFTSRARELFDIRDGDIGRPLAELASQIVYPELERDARAVLANVASLDREVRHSDDRRYLARLRPYRSLDDEIEGVVVTFVDLTALRRTQDELRRKRAMLELAEQAAHAGAWELDGRDRLELSEHALELSGIDPGSAPRSIGEWAERVCADARELEQAVEATTRGMREQVDVEVRIDGAGPRDRWLWVIGRRVGGRPGLAGIMVDITAARATRHALEEAARRKNEFIATLAHELRNPLTPLVAAIDIQRAFATDPERVARARELIGRQAAHLCRLVDDLLDIARIQTGRLVLTPEPRLALAAVIDDGCEIARPLVDEHQHRLIVDVPGDILITADRCRMAQVLGNLLTNAAKYSSRGSTITVTAQRDRDTVAVSVTDTGIGIDPAVLPRVFDWFVQAEPLETRSRGGLGIGLGLVKQLVELHGGSVVAESEGLTRGSRFTITLPLDPETEAP